MSSAPIGAWNRPQSRAGRGASGWSGAIAEAKAAPDRSQVNRPRLAVACLRCFVCNDVGLPTQFRRLRRCRFQNGRSLVHNGPCRGGCRGYFIGTRDGAGRPVGGVRLLRLGQGFLRVGQVGQPGRQRVRSEESEEMLLPIAASSTSTVAASTATVAASAHVVPFAPASVPISFITLSASCCVVFTSAC